MQTSWSQLFIGVLLWTIMMLIPVFINFFQVSHPVVSAALLTTLYPVILTYLVRYNRFWVSPTVIILSSMCALLTSLALNYGFKTKNTDVLTFVPVAVFVVALAGISTQMDMYGPNVYG